MSETPKITLEDQRNILAKRLGELEATKQSLEAEIRVTKNILKAFDKHSTKPTSK